MSKKILIQCATGISRSPTLIIAYLMIENKWNYKEVYEFVKSEGYNHIRRYDERSFDQLLRRPTVGCMIELFQIPHCRTVPIDSPAGKKIINRICYF
jgi:hypothetical protein